ncbi:MAG: 4a-hydroxytetrahydrobiopterin dehydratase [Planctomycetes bacterium]|nr:4a-hydroxytetrahydrobiopterin dehydratase [Planctomycetota bacterium]
MPKLTADELQKALADLTGWSVEGGKLRRVYKFKDFSEAFAFMTRCALAAEKMNHHPDWSNVWNTVTVDLITHDAGGITQNDVKLAQTMNKLAGA